MEYGKMSRIGRNAFSLSSSSRLMKLPKEKRENLNLTFHTRRLHSMEMIAVERKIFSRRELES
jgi:hypothetical protein